MEEDLPHIFEMFYTRGRGHADAGQGIGLGLAICETIVQAHGGRILAENRKTDREQGLPLHCPQKHRKDGLYYGAKQTTDFGCRR